MGVTLAVRSRAPELGRSRGAAVVPEGRFYRGLAFGLLLAVPCWIVLVAVAAMLLGMVM